MGRASRKLARNKAKRLTSSVYGNRGEVAKLPYGPCFLSEQWRETHDRPGLVSVLLTRVLPDGRYLAGVAIVDRTCLGIKNAFKTKPLSATGLDQYSERMSSANRMEQVDTLEALSVVHHAIEYARKLGFPPHPDYPEEIFGPRPEVLLDTPHASDPKPLYVSGPNDDVDKVMRTLEEKVGRDNYEFLFEAGQTDWPL
ncbi:MAG: hypothetical protein GY847_27060 [Proteobacteria bacterium]|nr:hypothetical protein [Pseudomonadota bacterium]